METTKKTTKPKLLEVLSKYPLTVLLMSYFSLILFIYVVLPFVFLVIITVIGVAATMLSTEHSKYMAHFAMKLIPVLLFSIIGVFMMAFIILLILMSNDTSAGL